MSVPAAALAKGTMTHSGRMVSMHSGVPSLEDIALALSRIPRFGGHCRTPWSVLNHSLVCERIARNDYPNDAPLRLACLLHDAHEALTGDIPSPMKVPQMKVLQQQLDARIADAYFNGLWLGKFSEYAEEVHRIDYRALVAEAVTVGPPGIGRYNVKELFGSYPWIKDIDVVRWQVRMNGAEAADRREYFLRLVAELSQ